MTTDRVTQIAGEVIVSTASSQRVRVTQTSAEAIVSTPSSQRVRVTQVAVEVIVRRRPGWTIGAIRIA